MHTYAHPPAAWHFKTSVPISHLDSERFLQSMPGFQKACGLWRHMQRGWRSVSGVRNHWKEGEKKKRGGGLIIVQVAGTWETMECYGNPEHPGWEGGRKRGGEGWEDEITSIGGVDAGKTSGLLGVFVWRWSASLLVVFETRMRGWEREIERGFQETFLRGRRKEKALEWICRITQTTTNFKSNLGCLFFFL